MARFTLAGTVAVLIVGVATAVASRRVAAHEAVVDTRTTTVALARARVEPVVTNGLVLGNLTSIREVGTAVHRYVLDKSLVRVKIWRRDGTIVYSDETRLIGGRYPLSAHQLEVITSERVRAGVSDRSRPENRYERSHGKLLAVSLRIRTPGGHPLLFEASVRYATVSAAGDRIWRRFAPTIFGALLALELVQILLAWSLARRIRRRRIDHEDLADTGVVDNGVVDNGVVDAGIVGSALTDLLTRAHGTGIATTLDTVDLHDPLPPAVAELVYRAAREALRDALNHADATSVTVRVSDHDHVATLDVVDDGTGANSGGAEGKTEAAHLGVRALTDLVADAGGRLVVDSANGKGTRVHVEVPLP